MMKTPVTVSPLISYEFITSEEDAALDLMKRNPTFVTAEQYVAAISRLHRKLRTLEPVAVRMQLLLEEKDAALEELRYEKISMREELKEKDACIQRLEERVKLLEDRASMNSRNSSRPPSTDDPNKPPARRSTREPSERKPGGQPGHDGETLSLVKKPDEIVLHELETCACGCSLCGVSGEVVRRVQVFDLPEKLFTVVEHRVVEKRCPACGESSKGILPEDVKEAPAQYGGRILSLASYLRSMHFIPYQRVATLCREVFGLPLAKDTVKAAEERIHGNLAGFEGALVDRVAASEVVHTDETGLRVNGKTFFVQIFATAFFTLLGIFAFKGRRAIDAMGVLTGFTGTLVHDSSTVYWQYACKHALCGSHILRELIAAHENENQQWAKEMLDLLKEIKKAVDWTPNGALAEEIADSFSEKYRSILMSGKAELPPPKEKEPGKKGRQAASKAANLHRRLSKYENEVLLFMEKSDVPFTNNLAERGFRMVRLYQKVSGCARMPEGAKRFLRLRSYVDTVRKHGGDVFSRLQEAYEGKAWIPEKG